jgi:hypothetical protein
MTNTDRIVGGCGKRTCAAAVLRPTETAARLQPRAKGKSNIFLP